jgi:hypothetical protein
MLLGSFAGIFVLGIMMYGAVVITLKNTTPASPSPAPMQMHMSG